MWVSLLVIPPQGQMCILEELHSTHPGMNKMKSLARSYVWWPHMDVDLESMVQECSVCQSIRKLPPLAPLHPWEWPQEEPWERLHLDCAGPFMGKHFLITVDAHSKWIDATIASTTSSADTDQKQYMACHINTQLV